MTQVDKQEVLDALFKSWDDIDELLSGLADEQWREPTALPGWRVQDVVSHIIGTESFLSGATTPASDVDVSALPHVRNPIGEMNESWVRHLHDESPAAMLEKFRAVTGERRKALEALDDTAWNADAATPVGPDTYGRFMRVRVFDCWMHEQDIRYAVGIWTGDDVLLGGPADQALEEIKASMGYIVGKLGKAPDGSRVAFELTGPLQRTLRVAVDGRAKVVEEFDGDPTTTVRLDAVLFTRLAGGRTSAAENDGAIEIFGDEALGRQLVEHLNFVI